MKRPAPKICPCCGQVIAPKISLPPIKQRIYDALLRRPRTTDELCEIASFYRPGREPLRRNIYNHIVQLNKLLAAHGIVAKQLSRFGPYQLMALKATKAADRARNRRAA